MKLLFAVAVIAVLTGDAVADSKPLAAAKYASVGGKPVAIPHPDAKATVLVFVSSTCPIANGYAPEINRLTKKYKSSDVRIVVVHVEKDLTKKQADKHRKQFGYRCAVVLDPKRKLVKGTGATITPETAVLSPKGRLLYRGRIDDRFPDIGIQRDKPTKTELRDALNAILAGKPVPVKRTKAVGCFIE